MPSTKHALIALGLSQLSVFAALAWAFGQLPARVASHFNSVGAPDGWMSASGHTLIIGGAALGSAIVLLGVFYSLRFMPDASINLPNRERWLATARRAETFDYLFVAGVWLACFVTLFVLGMHLLVVDANHAVPQRMSRAVWLLSGGFLAVTVGWLVAVMRRFRRVD